MASSSSAIIHFLILTSIFLHTFNFCSAHNRRMLSVKTQPSALHFGSEYSASAPAEAEGDDAILPTVLLPIIFEEPSLTPSPPVQQQQEPAAANITPSFFPLPGFLPSLPNFPPFPFIPTLPFGPGFDTIPADHSIPPPPITEP